MPDFYGTIPDADAYHAARGNAAWENPGQRDIDKTAALIRASSYIDALGRRRMPNGAYLTLFPGAKAEGRAQTLEWPRTDAADYVGIAIAADSVPIEVEQATYEAALREMIAPGSLRPDYTPSEYAKVEKAGPWSEEHFAPAPGENPNLPMLAIVMDLLAPVLLGRTLGLAIMVV